MRKEDGPTRPAPAIPETAQREAMSTSICAASHPERLPSYDRVRNRLLDQKRTDCQSVHSRASKAIYSFFGRANDRLVFVEAGVQKYGYSGGSMKSRNEIVIQRVFITSNGLQAARVVNVIDCA